MPPTHKPGVGGDVQSLPLGSKIVTGLQGRPVSGIAPSKGQTLVWNGQQWAPGYTASHFLNGPPANPYDGQVWIATQVGGPTGITWQFRYKSDSLSTYKWEFIGGAPLNITTSAAPTWNPGNWTAWPGLSYTTERVGDWVAWGSYSGTGNAGAATSVYATVDAATVVGGGTDLAASANFDVVAPQFTQTLAVFSSIDLLYYVSAAPATIRGASFSVLPKRIN